MENMKLNEQDLKMFGELFAMCDVENSGKISGPKASELFITSGLSHEVLHEIIILCGAKRLGHFGRSQFYVALKLIAAVQHGFPVQLESISSGRDIPLPKFVKLESENTRGPVPNTSFQSPCPVGPLPQHHRIISNRMVTGFDQTNNVHSAQPVVSPTSPAEHHSPPTSPLVQQHAGTSGFIKHVPAHVPVSVISNSAHVHHAQAAAAAHTHVPTAGLQAGAAAAGYTAGPHFEAPSAMHQQRLEKGWASFEDDNQGLISDEKKEWTRFTDSSRADTSSLSSETDSVDDVWLISDELRKYYLNQFLTMQADIKGVISGAVAKEFFEKSKLPISELSKIWQLSDVNKDGALSFEEFNTAMHLVVCRINGVELPDQLPPSLMPYVSFTNPDEPFASDLPPGSTLKRLTPSSPAAAQQQWAPSFPQPSPSSSSVSSPGQGPRPVNFEFRPISEDQDSTIAHPVALRMSPDGQAFPADGKAQAQAQTQPDVGGYNSQDLSPNDQQSPPSKPPEPLVDISEDQSQANQVLYHPTPIQGRPRPTPKKAMSVPGPGHESLAAPMLPPPSSQEAPIEAPVPPPRTKSHSRSNSLDANQMLGADGVAPPVVPPRPKEGSTSNTEMSSSTLSASVTSPGEEKKVTPQHSGDDLDGKHKVLPKQDSEEKRDLRKRVKEQREKNLVLSRLNSELNQELQEVMEQRIALEIQMEHLRPYSGGYL